MKPLLRIAAVTALVLLTTSPGAAPPFIGYQGIVLDPAGQPMNGPVTLQFDLFSGATDPTSLWSETHAGVTLVDGVYSVELGATTPLDAALLDGAERWLEVHVNGEKLAPRQRLLSVPYALRAQSLDGAAVPSLDSLEGVPCRVGTPSVGTTQVIFSAGGQSPVSLACIPSNTWTLSVTVMRTNSGSSLGPATRVTSSPAGIACDLGTCAASYPGGTGITLTASTNGQQWAFDGWTGPCTASGTSCSTTMDAAKSVTATFHCPPTAVCSGF